MFTLTFSMYDNEWSCCTLLLYFGGGIGSQVESGRYEMPVVYRRLEGCRHYTMRGTREQYDMFWSYLPLIPSRVYTILDLYDIAQLPYV